MKWMVSVLAVYCLLLSSAGVVFAQDEVPEVEEGAAQRATKLFEKAETAYQNGEYAAALGDFLEAHSHFPDANILYNAARAAQRLGRWEQARSLALRAADQQVLPLSDGLAKANKRLLQEVEAKIEEEERRRIAEESRDLDWRGWTGVGAAVAGTAGVVIGFGVFGQQASEKSAEAALAVQRSEYDSLVEDMEQAQTWGILSVVTGSVFLAAGVGLLAWDLLDHSSEGPAIGFGLGPNGASATMGWSW